MKYISNDEKFITLEVKDNEFSIFSKLIAAIFKYGIDEEINVLTGKSKEELYQLDLDLKKIAKNNDINMN